ncbi:ACT domain-containing protein [Fusobacterium sp. MFO224]|uniref:ACT domain-containing protein n=1 Tax=Fusobacterium sp. MFO224 TaxID=3378070 RepID=UPI0038539BB9
MKLLVVVKRSPWALSRLIGLTSRLGIFLNEFSFKVDDKTSNITLSFSEENKKEIHLKKQIERLVDVFDVFELKENN